MYIIRLINNFVALPTVILAVPVAVALLRRNVLGDVALILVLQEYSPNCSLPNELITAVLIHTVRFRIIVLFGRIVTPYGPLHTVFTVNGTSTAGLSSTVQVRVILDPIGRMGLEMLLSVTRDGAGTINMKIQ